MCTTAVDLDTRLLYYSNAPCTLYHGSPAVFGLHTSISMGDAAGLISLAQKTEPQCIMLSYTARRTCVVANGARQIQVRDIN